MTFPPLPVDPSLYLAFLAVMTVMAATPGPANLFAVATGVKRGRATVLAAVAGMNAATLVWFGAAALGLGALIAAFPQVFRWIAVGGAAYVAWLGLKTLRGAVRAAAATQGPAVTESPRPAPRGSRSALVDGFLVQIANPKAVLFFTAVLPPFMDASRPAAPQLALFAAATVGLDVASMTAYGLAGAALTRRMDRPGFRRGFDALAGLLLLAVAVLIVTRL